MYVCLFVCLQLLNCPISVESKSWSAVLLLSCFKTSNVQKRQQLMRSKGTISPHCLGNRGNERKREKRERERWIVRIVEDVACCVEQVASHVLSLDPFFSFAAWELIDRNGSRHTTKFRPLCDGSLNGRKGKSPGSKFSKKSQ
jgi:hypothetical protein